MDVNEILKNQEKGESNKSQNQTRQNKITYKQTLPLMHQSMCNILLYASHYF